MTTVYFRDARGPWWPTGRNLSGVGVDATGGWLTLTLEGGWAVTLKVGTYPHCDHRVVVGRVEEASAEAPALVDAELWGSPQERSPLARLWVAQGPDGQIWKLPEGVEELIYRVPAEPDWGEEDDRFGVVLAGGVIVRLGLGRPSRRQYTLRAYTATGTLLLAEQGFGEA